MVSEPLALLSSILGLFIDGRKRYAIAGLVVSGAMAACIGGSIVVAMWC
jgi:hypothetical protein